MGCQIGQTGGVPCWHKGQKSVQIDQLQPRHFNGHQFSGKSAGGLRQIGHHNPISQPKRCFDRAVKAVFARISGDFDQGAGQTRERGLRHLARCLHIIAQPRSRCGRKRTRWGGVVDREAFHIHPSKSDPAGAKTCHMSVTVSCHSRWSLSPCQPKGLTNV